MPSVKNHDQLPHIPAGRYVNVQESPDKLVWFICILTTHCDLGEYITTKRGLQYCPICVPFNDSFACQLLKVDKSKPALDFLNICCTHCALNKNLSKLMFGKSDHTVTTVHANLRNPHNGQRISQSLSELYIWPKMPCEWYPHSMDTERKATYSQSPITASQSLCEPQMPLWKVWWKKQKENWLHRC